MEQKSLVESLWLTTQYLQAQEKRAEIELGDHLSQMDEPELLKLSEDIAAMEESELAVSYVSTLLKQSSARQRNAVKAMTKAAADAPDTKSYILDMVNRARGTASELTNRAVSGASNASKFVRNNLDNPLMMGAVGGGTGAALGGLKGLISGEGYGGLTSDILRGGLAGAAVGAGGSLAYGAARSRGVPNDPVPVEELNDAISGYNSGSSLLTPEAAGIGYGLGVNALDNAAARRSPAAAFRVANVRRYSDRTDVINRLNKWLLDNEKTPGRDSVDAFTKLLSSQSHPDGTRLLMNNLSKELSQPGGMVAANDLLANRLRDAGLLGDGIKSPHIKPDVDAVARALSGSQPGGLQFAPANVLQRTKLDGLLTRILGDRTAPPVLSAVNNANAALAKPRFRGRAGLLGAMGLLAGGYGVRQLLGGDSPAVTPEAMDNIKNQLKSL